MPVIIRPIPVPIPDKLGTDEGGEGKNEQTIL